MLENIFQQSFLERVAEVTLPILSLVPLVFKAKSTLCELTTHFLSTVVNRRTFSQSRLKQFYKSPHDSYHDYKRNNFSNLAETIGVEPIQLFSCLRFSKPSHYRSGMLPNSRHCLGVAPPLLCSCSTLYILLDCCMCLYNFLRCLLHQQVISKPATLNIL